MSEKEEKKETFLVVEISFPKAPKKAKDKQTLFTKFLSLIEESKESLPIEVEFQKRRRSIILDSDEFMFNIYFGKKGATIRMRVTVHDPEKNIDIANEVGNKVVNYMNTILGKGATETRVFSHQTTLYSNKIANLSKKIIGEGRITKINEEVKQILGPIGVFFEYKMNDRDFAFGILSDEKGAETLLSRITYKDKMPFDLIRIEHDELGNPASVIKRLTEMEL